MGNQCVAAHDHNGYTGCGVPVPVRPETWGAIKAQYR
jgi:hypothetical protein